MSSLNACFTDVTVVDDLSVSYLDVRDTITSVNSCLTDVTITGDLNVDSIKNIGNNNLVLDAYNTLRLERRGTGRFNILSNYTLFSNGLTKFWGGVTVEGGGDVNFINSHANDYNFTGTTVNLNFYQNATTSTRRFYMTQNNNTMNFGFLYDTGTIYFYCGSPSVMMMSMNKANGISFGTNVVNASNLTVSDFLAIPTSVTVNPVAGSSYFDSATNTLYIHNGTSWVSTVLT